MFVDAGRESNLGLERLIFNAGDGTNWLTLQVGTVRIDSTSSENAALFTTVESGAHLITARIEQYHFNALPHSRVTLLPGGGTSFVRNLGVQENATLDISDNAIVVEHFGNWSAADFYREKILSGRGGPGFGSSWTGTGITSSTARAANVSEPEAWSVGYAENAALPLGAYENFRGVAVDETAVLIAYTRTGDANLDGVVNDDDVTIVSATYAPGVPQPHWALGDYDYNGFVDDDDVTLLGAFYQPAVAAQKYEGQITKDETAAAAPKGPEDRDEEAPTVRSGVDIANDMNRSEGPTLHSSQGAGPPDLIRHELHVDPGPDGPGYFMPARRAYETFGPERRLILRNNRLGNGALWPD